MLPERVLSGPLARQDSLTLPEPLSGETGQPILSRGGEFNVINLLGSKAGRLFCYDNNLSENIRITVMFGAKIILMPPVTCCLPTRMSGRGTVNRKHWQNRHPDLVRLRQEFHGLKERKEFMR